MINLVSGITKPLQGPRILHAEKRDKMRQTIREIEAHAKTITNDKAEQIAIVSKAQGLTIDNEYHLAILIIVKRRITRG